MSISLTKNARILLAKQVYNLLDLSANSYLPAERKSYMYVILGKPLPWNSGTEVVPTASESQEEIYNIHRNGMFAKQVSYENASLVTRRINWTTGTVYSTYDQAVNLFVNDDIDFYVLNSKDQVFKCLSNNNDSESTTEPQLTISTTSLEEPFVETSDGYKWKYLYTLTSTQKQKFMDDNWMPVTYNKFVKAAAVPGSIDIIELDNPGTNYTDGTLQSIITITGDGTGAVVKANVSGGEIQNFIIQNRGSGYSYADVTINDVSGGVGQNASAHVVVSPFDGHGYDPVYELLAYNIMFNSDFSGIEGGIFPAENDYRQVSLIHNPVFLTSTGSVTTHGETGTLYTKVKVSPGAGIFNNDEIVFQGLTYSDATFTAKIISFDEVSNYLYLNDVRGTLENNKSIKGYTSGEIRVVNSNTTPSIQPYSGKVLYISDILPVRRDPSQTERVRFILSF